MQRITSILFLIVLCSLSVEAQRSAKQYKGVPDLKRFVGRYETQGGVIQFALEDDRLVLVVPGAPIQHLANIDRNSFESTVFRGQYFRFEEEKGKVVAVIIEGNGDPAKAKKISDHVKVLSNAMDSVLVLKKSTQHFLFLFGASDANAVDTIALQMEENYTRILGDLKLKEIPTVKVRVYPDLQSFHKGINFPDAPDQVLATAFGTDDIRMVSPRNAGPERWMFAYAAPHEFTHVVHLNISYAPNNPRWLWEGVAQYEAKWFFNPAEIDMITKKEFPTLTELGNGMEYMLGFAIIDAIKEIWGFDTVISLIKTNGDVPKVLDIDQSLFEEKIFEHIHKKYVKP